MKKIAAKVEQLGGRGFIARTHDRDVMRKAGCHLWACGSTPEQAEAKLQKLASELLGELVETDSSYSPQGE